jgi:hypothetical protein
MIFFENTISRVMMVGLLPSFGSGSSGGALSNSPSGGAVLSTFSVEKRGARAVLEEKLMEKSPLKHTFSLSSKL